MNLQEFEAWLENYYAAFPAALAFVNSSPDSVIMLNYWFDALEPFQQADALEATRRMVVGLEPVVPAVDRSQTASHVAAICGRLCSERVNAELGGSSKPWQLERESDGEPRYRCRDCSDTGLVVCWSPETMRLAARGGAVPGGRGLYSCAVVCHCKAGDRYDAMSRGGWDRRRGEFRWASPVRFNWSQWLPYGGHSAEAIADLCEFVAEEAA